MGTRPRDMHTPIPAGQPTDSALTPAYELRNPGRSELVQRLLADTCELCGSQHQVEVHHIRALRDLNPKGRTQLPEWALRMAARRRKTLVVCRACHEGIHYSGSASRQT